MTYDPSGPPLERRLPEVASGPSSPLSALTAKSIAAEALLNQLIDQGWNAEDLNWHCTKVLLRPWSEGPNPVWVYELLVTVTRRARFLSPSQPWRQRVILLTQEGTIIGQEDQN